MNVHNDHRLLVGAAAGLFLFLSMIIAVLPAFEAEKTPLTPGLAALTGEAARGREIYLEEGCGVCHTQFVRDLPVDEPYGRGSLPGDYALESPPLLGTQRTGPDLSNVGVRQPSDVWNLIHLYNPRAVVSTSVMPGYPWLFEHKSKAKPEDVVVAVPDGFKPAGTEVVASAEAIALIRYLQSLQQAEVEQ